MLSVQLFALYHLGMVPGILDLKGEGTPWIFMTFSGGQKGKKHENAGWTWSDFGLWSSQPAQNDLLKNPENLTQHLPEISKTFENVSGWGYAGIFFPQTVLALWGSGVFKGW